MRVIPTAVLAAAFAAGPLAAQGHEHHTPPDSSQGTRHECPMAAMHRGTMQPHQMMGGADSTSMRGMMGGDTAMMATLRFAPRVVLAHGDALSLSAEQREKIEALAAAPGDTSAMGMAHMHAVHAAAAAVRALLTPDQVARAERLPTPCPMMQGSPVDSTAGSGHQTHHR